MRRPRLAEHVALGVSAALVLNPDQLVFGFNAFRRHQHAERSAEAHDRSYDGHRLRRIGYVANERSVDLDLVEGKAAQITQAGIAGAKIVHRNPRAELPE